MLYEQFSPSGNAKFLSLLSGLKKCTDPSRHFRENSKFINNIFKYYYGEEKMVSDLFKSVFTFCRLVISPVPHVSV